MYLHSTIFCFLIAIIVGSSARGGKNLLYPIHQWQNSHHAEVTLPLTGSSSSPQHVVVLKTHANEGYLHPNENHPAFYFHRHPYSINSIRSGGLLVNPMLIPHGSHYQLQLYQPQSHRIIHPIHKDHVVQSTAHGHGHVIPVPIQIPSHQNQHHHHYHPPGIRDPRERAIY